MDRLTYLMEHEAMVRAEVKSAMRYPLLVVGALVVAFTILVGFVIPKFATFFLRADITLPLPTRICLVMSDFFVNNGLLLIGMAIGVVLAFRYLPRIPRVRFWRDVLLLKIPLVGQVLIKSTMSRFASIFSILQSSGVMVLESMELVSKTVENRAIAVEFAKVHKAIEEGQGVAEPLRSASYFPPLLTSMVAVGEETGHLDEMLRITSDHFDMELRHSMKKLTAAIGPILIVSLTVIVGFFALAIYLPMWELTQMAH
jgi:type IV pilus assembly protein PilC